jgi:zinc transport system substrate-binding protein
MVGIFSRFGKRSKCSQKLCIDNVHKCYTQKKKAYNSLFLVLVMISLLIFFSGCSVQTNADSKEFLIATSFFPYYEFTKAVVLDSSDVSVIVSPKLEPHDFEPSIRDIENLRSVHALVVSGVDFEPYESQFEAAVGSNVRIIHASEGLTLLEGSHDHSHEDDLDNHTEVEDDVHSDEEDVHDVAGKDPHVWVSLKNAKVIVQNIANELSEVNPDLAEQYAQNAQSYIGELDKLDMEYERVLATCEYRELFVTHNAFAYLALYYDLEVISISGLSHDVEPSAQELAHLIEEAKYHNVRAIFSEELVSDSVAQTIAREVGAQVLPLSDASGSPRGLSYLDLMRENLNNLKIGLACDG